MATYHWLHVRADGRTWNDAYARLVAELDTSEVWGAFSGLFGLASSELMLVVRRDQPPPLPEIAAAGFEVVDSLPLAATVRPTTPKPLTRPGLYVLRFFTVGAADIDEVARLSEEAWTTFEGSEDYAAEAQALFAQTDLSEPMGPMLLVTWYDGFDSWQSSRQPAPEAAANFRRRRALTGGTIAYATRLVGT